MLKDKNLMIYIMYPNTLYLIALGTGNKGKEPSCGAGWTKPENFTKYTQHVKNTKAPMYGVLTGKHNNIIVVDYDIYNKPDCGVTLQSLKHVHGSGAYIVQTQSGGFHVYHTYQDKHEDWGNITGVQDFIDIRSTNGYIVGGKSTGYKELSGNIEKLTLMPDTIFTALDNGVRELREKNKSKSGIPKTVKEQDTFIIETLQKTLGFTGVILKGNNRFDCDRTGECPCCDGQHTRQDYFYRVGNDGVMMVKNYSDSCKFKIIDTYKVVKYFFEQKVCRIDDTVNYAVSDGDYLTLYSTSDFKQRFSHLVYQDAKGKHKFVTTWLDDANKHSYTRMDFYPENCPPNVYNTWKPFSASTITEGGGNADMFFELLDILTVKDPKDYARKYLAYLTQKPNKKPTTCLVFRGIEGTGKGRLFYALTKVFGRHLVSETSNPQQDVFGTNADAYNQTKLVIMNESNATLNFANGDRLKALITDEDGLKINQKYIKPYNIRNLAGTIIAGNGKTIVNSSVTDRRFVIYETGEDKVNDEDYFGRFTDYIDQPKNQKAIYDALMAIDLTGWNLVKDRPTETKAYREAKEKCLPKLVKFLEWDFMEEMAYPLGTKMIPLNETGSSTVKCVEDMREYDEDVSITATDYCEKFKEWSGGDDKFMNRVKFGIAMRSIIKDHNIPDDVIYKKDTKRGVIYYRNRGKGVRWLKEKMFTSREPIRF